jgi:hypothetical protein
MRFMRNQRLFRIKVGSPDDFAPFQCLVRVVSNSLTIAEPLKHVAPITKTPTLISSRRPRPVEEIGCSVSFMPFQCRHRQHCSQCKHRNSTGVLKNIEDPDKVVTWLSDPKVLAPHLPSGWATVLGRCSTRYRRRYGREHGAVGYPYRGYRPRAGLAPTQPLFP